MATPKANLQKLNLRVIEHILAQLDSMQTNIKAGNLYDPDQLYDTSNEEQLQQMVRSIVEAIHDDIEVDVITDEIMEYDTEELKNIVPIYN